MAIISDVKEEEAKPSSSLSPSPKPTSFNSSFDPSNTVAFLEKVFDFIEKESDFLGKENVDKEVVAMVRVAKDRYYKKKAEEAAKEKEKEKEKKKKKMLKEIGGKPNNPNLKDPNKGNGYDFERYSWTQTLQEVTVTVPVPPGTRAKSVDCQMKKSSLKVGLKGQNHVIDGFLFKGINPDDCYWTMDENDTISIVLSKQNQLQWWKCLIKGEPEIDTTKVEPESSRISDLDPETRQTVEKLMFDQKQKALGLPTSDEIQKQAMLKQCMEMNPDMDFSNAKMM